MKFTVKAYTNDGPGRFWGYQPGDKLTPVPVEMTFEVEPPPIPESGPLAELLSGAGAFEAMVRVALNNAWSVGNRMWADDEGVMWPPTVRSLSVGDVLAVSSSMGVDHLYGVASFGFDAFAEAPHGMFHFAVSLSEFARVNEAGM